MSMNRVAAGFVALFLVAGPIAFGDEPVAPVVVKTYPVADLVPLSKPASKVDLVRFGEFVAKGAGIPSKSVVPFNLSLSLIVRGNAAEQEAFAARLKFLREYEQMKAGIREFEERVDQRPLFQER